MIAKFRSRNIAERWSLLIAVSTLLGAVATEAQPQAPAAQQPPASQAPAAQPAAPAQAGPAPASVAGIAAPANAEYVIGPEDVLSIVYWRDKDMTGDVTVRADG